MTSSERAVVVEKVPERCNARIEREFMRQLEKRTANVARPALVLDCSRVRLANKELVHLLFSCLEEALKRNGDVRLAGIRPELWPSLQAAGVGRLFRVFASSGDAVGSFGPASAARRVALDPDQPAANAA